LGTSLIYEKYTREAGTFVPFTGGVVPTGSSRIGGREPMDKKWHSSRI